MSRFIVISLMTAVGFVLTNGAIAQLSLAIGSSPDRPSNIGSTQTTYYFDQSSYKKEVAAAADFWNRSGTRVHLSPTQSKRHADILVATKPLKARLAGLTSGSISSQTGWFVGQRTITLEPDLSSRDRATELPARLTYAAEVATHEFGHALGLSHTKVNCDLMSPNGYYNDDACDLPEKDRVRCGQQRGDVVRMAEKYGWFPGALSKFQRDSRIGTCLSR